MYYLLWTAQVGGPKRFRDHRWFLIQHILQIRDYRRLTLIQHILICCIKEIAKWETTLKISQQICDTLIVG